MLAHLLSTLLSGCHSCQPWCKLITMVIWALWHGMVLLHLSHKCRASRLGINSCAQLATDSALDWWDPTGRNSQRALSDCTVLPPSQMWQIAGHGPKQSASTVCIYCKFLNFDALKFRSGTATDCSLEFQCWCPQKLIWSLIVHSFRFDSNRQKKPPKLPKFTLHWKRVNLQCMYIQSEPTNGIE